ncbi:MAG: AIR synthase family protein [candidate division KSB1 bacterium]|nr:AIR synthase family protein [candidate division KSB1 bacterium]MDZ7305089.1 AIR synthase family protein [candidate division KSB1 bacterium]MDZ7313406.1 AIR synthase family protein [candidate division KSB1 bacterium]
MFSSHRLPDFFPVGKLPLGFLETLLKKYATPASGDHRVKVGAGLGKDAAVIEFGDRLLIAKTDPITFVAEDIGYYALHINANDVACMGGDPKWFLATLLLPESTTTPDLVEEIFKQLSQACKKIGATLCGGHTEITPGLNHPVVVGCLLGETRADRFFSPERIEVGDAIILTKGLAVEATSIIGREHAQALAKAFDMKFAKNCRRFLHDPGISVLPEARLAWNEEGIHALHDPTEGGLANAIHELLAERDLGIEIELASIPLFPETKLLCEHFHLDILGLIASGALLIAGTEQACTKVLSRLHRQRISANIIGRILPAGEGKWLFDGKQRVELPFFRRDEILKVLQ